MKDYISIYFYFSFPLVFLMSSCGVKEEVSVKKMQQSYALSSIKGYSNIEQNISKYIENFDSNKTFTSYTNSYDDIYFTPYTFEKAPYDLETIQWPFRSYRFPKFYGENLQKYSKIWFELERVDANFEEYDTLHKYATTLHFTSLRSFPTNKPLFLDPKKAGEGFPFDYLQNSAVHANEPLYVSHYNKTKEWIYVFTSYADGWVKSRDIIFLPKDNLEKIKNSQKVHIIKEHFPIYDMRGNFLFMGRIGMSFPIIEIKKNSVIVLLITKEKTVHYEKVELEKSNVSISALQFNRKNLEMILSQFIGLKYGWGGMYENRDCSSTIRDLFATFGIWLPRNSAQQSQVGRVIELDGLSDKEKKEKIVSKGKPFETLLYKKGHILLYLGQNSRGEIIVLHDMWGIKTVENGVVGRLILGKTVISTLDVGSNVAGYDSSNSLIHTLKSMNIVTE